MRPPLLPNVLQKLRDYWYVALGLVVVLPIVLWLVTYGSWSLFAAESEHASFSDVFYASQTERLLHGRLDVPRRAISWEAFVQHGRWYGYFGIGPALIRVPLQWCLPSWGWNKAMMLGACMLNLWCACVLLNSARRLAFRSRPRTIWDTTLYALFVILVGLGSSNLFLASRAFVYHEAMAWGSALALACYTSLVAYLIRPRLRYICLAGICAFLSVASRAAVGAGTLLCLLLFAAAAVIGMQVEAMQERARRRPVYRWCGVPIVSETPVHVSLAVLFVLLSVLFYWLINYAKFGTVHGMPHDLYVRFTLYDDPERLGGGIYHLSNFRTGIFNYFSPKHIEFSKNFPWVYQMPEPKIFPEAKIDMGQPIASLSASTPALLLLAVTGVIAAFQRGSPFGVFRLPLVASLAAGSLLVFFVGLFQRYLHDLFPFLVLAGVVGLHAVMASRPWVRRTGLALIILLIPYSVYVNLAISIHHQRVFLPELSPHFYEGDTAKTAEFRRVCRKIDSWLGVAPRSE